MTHEEMVAAFPTGTRVKYKFTYSLILDAVVVGHTAQRVRIKYLTTGNHGTVAPSSLTKVEDAK